MHSSTPSSSLIPALVSATMRRLCAVLPYVLALVILMAAIDSATPLVDTDSDQASAVDITNPRPPNPIKRLLRFRNKGMSEIQHSNDEERGFETITKTVQKLISALKPATRLDKTWLAARKNPVDVFDFLLLDRTGVSALENNPKFFRWLRNTNKHREGETDASKLSLLDDELYMLLRRTRTTDEDFDHLILWIRKAPELKNLVDSLEAARFARIAAFYDKKWLADRKHPLQVFDFLSLDKTGTGALENNPHFFRWLRYANKYRQGETDPAKLRALDKELYRMLSLTRTTDEDVDKLFLSIRQFPELSNLADALHKARLIRHGELRGEQAKLLRELLHFRDMKIAAGVVAKFPKSIRRDFG